jgi:hypothetical protein
LGIVQSAAGGSGRDWVDDAFQNLQHLLEDSSYGLFNHTYSQNKPTTTMTTIT